MSEGWHDVSLPRSGGETRDIRVQLIARVWGPAPMSTRADLWPPKVFNVSAPTPSPAQHSLDANAAHPLPLGDDRYAIAPGGERGQFGFMRLQVETESCGTIYSAAADCIAGGVDGGFGLVDASSRLPPAISSSSSLRFSASPKAL